MKNLSRVVWLCVWLGAALYLAFTLWLGFAGLVYPFQLVDGDGVAAAEAVAVHPLLGEAHHVGRATRDLDFP